MKNIKLVIEYNGTNYCGWQIQNNGISVQEVVQKAIFELTGEQITVVSSGRTDAGVHAFGQVCNFKTECTIPPEKLAHALNPILPNDIVIQSSEQVDDHFHSRFSSVSKTYKYLILNSEQISPIFSNNSGYFKKTLNIELMKEAANMLKGEHDFAAFMAVGSSVETTVRTIYDIHVKRLEDFDKRLIEISVTGNGFLYNMVRIIAGTLIEVGAGIRQSNSILEALCTKDRKCLGFTAPACGLYLYEVEY